MKQETNIGLKKEELENSRKILDGVLANEIVLDMKVRNYHWNVKALNFIGLHEFFEMIYDKNAERIDEIAERIRFLWAEVEWNYKHFLEVATLDEEHETWLSKETMVKNLLADKEKHIRILREAIEEIDENSDEDMGTEDFLTAIIQVHEKEAWMLRSMVEDIES